MTSEILYTYLGTNGTVTTPVHLEGVPAIKNVRLRPAPNKKLTDGKRCVVDSITVSEAEVANWREI